MNDVNDKAKGSDSAYSDILHEYEEFAYVVSHDLQAPIRQLHGFSQSLLNELGEDLSPVQEAYRDMIEHVAQEASQTLSALLQFSRLSTDDKDLQPVDLNEALSEALQKAEIENPGIAYDVEQDDLPIVTGDFTLLMRALNYLLDNCFKFRKDDEKLKLNISINAGNSCRVFCIEDNGVGIPQDKQGYIFTLLRTFGDKDKVGCGVGLTFARKIMRIHEGDLWMQSKPGRGTQVFFTLGLSED